MNKKRITALIMTLVMAVGMSLVVTACGDESASDQTEEQATVEETEETSAEDPSEVAETVDEYVTLAGEYQDEFSQRASATVVANTESRNVNITVMWSSSATEATMWTMNAEKDGNQLIYSDCVRTELIYSDETDDEGTVDEETVGDTGGGAEETVVYENGSGSFEISDEGKLLWTGAADADCQECVFVKVVE